MKYIILIQSYAHLHPLLPIDFIRKQEDEEKQQLTGY